MQNKRDKKLDVALKAIASGLDVNGQPINLVLVAAEAQASTMKFAKKIRQGEARTRRKLRGARYKG